MSQLLNGSICLSDLNAQAKISHSAFSRGKNGKIYFNFSQWINEEADQYKNHSSLLLNSSKEKKDAEGKIYIGNARISEYVAQEVGEVTADELLEDDDAPF